MPAAGGTPALLLRGSNHVWNADGQRLLYVNREAEASTVIEVADLIESTSGLAVRNVAAGVVTIGTLQDLALSADQRHLLVVGVEKSMNLTRVALNAQADGVVGAEEELSAGQVRDRFPAVSPDGTRIAVGLFLSCAGRQFAGTVAAAAARSHGYICGRVFSRSNTSPLLTRH